MSRDKVKRWLPAFAMIAALVVDVKWLHFTGLTLLVFIMCVAGGMREWKSRHVKSALVLFLFSCGLLFALNHMTRQWGVDRRLARSVANAVRCYNQFVGHPPQTLQDLVPKYLTRLPEFQSPLVGNVRYKLVSNSDWCVMWNGGGDCSNIGPKLECSVSTSKESVDVRRH